MLLASMGSETVTEKWVLVRERIISQKKKLNSNLYSQNSMH